MTPEEKIKRRRLNRKLLMFVWGPAGLLLTVIAVGFGLWWMLVIGLPFVLFAFMAWRSDPNKLPS